MSLPWCICLWPMGSTLISVNPVWNLPVSSVHLSWAIQLPSSEKHNWNIIFSPVQKIQNVLEAGLLQHPNSTMLAVKRWKGVTLVTLGILFCIIGLLVGTNVLPNALLKRLKEATCVDSAQSSSYDSWVSCTCLHCFCIKHDACFAFENTVSMYISST